MRAVEFLEFAGVEIANSARTTAYARTLGVTGLTMGAECPCELIDEGYTSPEEDDAAWYEPTRPESEQFFGLYADSIEVVSTVGRQVSPAGRNGSSIGPERLGGLQVQVSGKMIAQTASGMAYGEAWLKEALRGYPCESGCPGDDLCILPACPEDVAYGSDAYFRTLVRVARVDGPVFTQVGSGVPECLIQRVAFNLVSAQPYLYHPATRCLDGVALEAYASPLACSLTTPQWMGEGTFVIDIVNADSVPTTDIVITGRISLDGSCPVTGDGTSVPPSFVYTIPTLGPEDRIVIDGMRQQARYYDASEKYASSAMPYIEWDGAFEFPSVGTCTTMCIEIEGAGGDAEVTVDSVLREVG